MDLCLSDCYFIYDSYVHQLENSGPIGLALILVVTEAYLKHYEEKALAIASNNNVDVKSFYRYVDDSRCRVNSIEDAESFLSILNDQSKHLKYTMETSEVYNGNI